MVALMVPALSVPQKRYQTVHSLESQLPKAGLLWMYCVFPKFYVEALTPNGNIFGYRGFKEKSKVKWGNKAVVLIQKD